jgi:hypothetical protein
MSGRNTLGATVTALALILAGRVTAADPAQPVDLSWARVKGIVVDESGRPVKGALVRVPQGKTKPDAATGVSGPDGKFLLVLDQALARGRDVLAGSEGGARQGILRTDDMDIRGIVDVRLVLKPSREVTVHVVDEQTKPVAGALVVALASVTLPVANGETDAKGMARLRLPAEAKMYYIVGMKEGVGFDYFENYKNISNRSLPPLPAEVKLVLDGNRTCQVQLTDSAQHPLPNIPVVPWTIKKQGKIRDVNLSGCSSLPRLAPQTNSQGTVTFNWLPRNAGGVTFLSESAQYHQPQNPYFEPAQKETRLSAQLYRLVPASGKVTLPDGKPAGGILLQAEGQGHTNMYFRGYARTAADGSYRFRLYPDQTYIVGLLDKDWAAPSHVGISVKEGQRLTDLDFRLGRGTLLEGRMTVGPDRKPLANELIDIMQKSVQPNAHLYTGARGDANGHYQIRLGPGTYEIRGPDWERQELVIRDEPRIEKNFALPRPRLGPLHGLVVTREDGRPIAGAKVQAQAAEPSGGGFEDIVTDNQGRFTVEQRLLARAWVYAQSADGQLAGLAAVTAEDTEVKVSLRPAATLVGRLVGKDGKPLPDVRLVCRLEVGPKEALAGRAQFWGQADRQGRFVVGGLVPGSRCKISAYTGNAGVNELKEVFVKSLRTIELGTVVFDLEP